MKISFLVKIHRHQCFLIITVLMLLAQCAFCGTYGGGAGTAENPYVISTAEHMQEIGANESDWVKHFVLTCDIDLAAYTGEEYNVIGYNGTPFDGTFNGSGHIISNLTIEFGEDPVRYKYIGLFGLIGESGEIKNISLENANIIITYRPDSWYIGSLVGSNRGAITNCYATSSVNSENGFYVGGLVGRNTGLITKCYADTDVVGIKSVGGLAGRNEGYFTSGTITKSFAKGNVTGDNEVGGLIGNNSVRMGYETSSTLTDCYSTCTVSGYLNVGSFTGVNGGSITNCYSTGVASGEEMVGGFVGFNDPSGSFKNCFWDILANDSVRAVGNVSNPAGLKYKGTPQLKRLATFTDYGWDFFGEDTNGSEDIWRMCSDGLTTPKFKWEYDKVGDYLCPDGFGIDDLSRFAEYWLTTEPKTDINYDGITNLSDYASIQKNWFEVDIEFVDIPGGTFEMGDALGDSDFRELPIHTVTISPFRMSKYEITNAQYAEYLNSANADGLIKVVEDIVYATSDILNLRPYFDTKGFGYRSMIKYRSGRFMVLGKGGRSMLNDPVVGVSWYGAIGFCDYYGYRLPTESEWEYAARGGLSGKRFPWGDTISHNQANFQSFSSINYDLSPTSTDYHPTWDDGINPLTSPVGSFSPNGYGLYDMAGNVIEWCSDWDKGYPSEPQTDPTGPESGSFKILRGGSWEYSAKACRLAFRANSHLYYMNRNNGFRVCHD